MRMAYTTNEKVGRVRIQAIRLLREGMSTREVARYLGYAQGTIVKWNKRKNEAKNQRELPTRSSRPKTSPCALSQEIVGKIIEARVRTKRCAEVVYEELKDEGVSVSLSSVKRVLSQHNLLKKRSPWKKKRRYPIRPDVAKQGDLVELDTIHFVNKYGKRSYVYTAIDVYSRYGYAMISEKATAQRSVFFLKKVRSYFPFKISCIQTDNGSEFGRWFTDHCKTKHRHNHPRSPNENGHLERFNRTFQEEPERYGLSIFIEKDVKAYLKYYNTKRRHMGIEFKTPAQMVKK